MAGFGYVAFNSQSPCSPHVPNLPCPCQNCCPCHLPPPPPLPQNKLIPKVPPQESSDSEDGDSLIANCGHPLNYYFFFSSHIFLLLF